MHTHTHMHAHTSLDKQSNIAAIVGGVVGGLVALGIIVLVGLLFGITVAVKLRKRGTSLIIIIAKWLCSAVVSDWWDECFNLYKNMGLIDNNRMLMGWNFTRRGISPIVIIIILLLLLLYIGELDALKCYEELAIDDVEQYKSKDVHLEESPSNAEKDDH